MSNQQGYAYQRYKSIRAYVENSECFRNWTGNRATKICNSIKKDIVSEYMQYVLSIDRSIESLGHEITKLERESRQLRWSIQQLEASINKLSKEIDILLFIGRGD